MPSPPTAQDSGVERIVQVEMLLTGDLVILVNENASIAKFSFISRRESAPFARTVKKEKNKRKIISKH